MLELFTTEVELFNETAVVRIKCHKSGKETVVEDLTHKWGGRGVDVRVAYAELLQELRRVWVGRSWSNVCSIKPICSWFRVDPKIVVEE